MIRKFALKTVVKNKTKSICAVIAMLLTTIMFCTLYTTVMGIHNAQEYSNIKSIGTTGQVVLKDCNEETENAFKKIKENDMVESAGYRQYLADVINEELKYEVEFSYEDASYAEHCFQQLTGGHMPSAMNEVAMDRETMKALDIKAKVGEPVLLDLKIGTGHFKKKFILSGWFNENSATEIKTGQIIVSKAYDKYWNENYQKEDVYGQTTIDILLKDNKNIEKQISMLLSDVGINDKVDYSINPGYTDQSFLMDTDNLIISIAGIVIIIIIGFLIIHNIFYIAALKEEKEYGRLKALGMNKKQIGKFVKWQAAYLLMIAVPSGVVSGYFIGKKLIPILLSQTNLRGVEGVNLIQTKDFLIVLILSIFFVVFTTIISIYGPLRKVKSLSPVESEKIELKLKKNTRTASDGNKLYKFAYQNIKRNKKNVVLVVMSITFTIILIGISYSLIGSFDINKYLSKMLYSDYRVGTENFFTSNYLLSDGTVADIQNSFQYAKNQQIIISNPAPLAIEICKKEKKITKPPTKKNAFTLNELMNLLLTARKMDYTFYLFLLLSASTGARVSETRAICFSKIDFQKKQLLIDCQLGRGYDNEGFDDNTLLSQKRTLKTRNSKRYVPLPDFIMDELYLARARYEETLKNDPEFDENLDFVLFRDHGKAIARPYYYFKKLMKKCNIDCTKHVWHDLRHTYATLLDQNNMNMKVVSEILGHYSEEFTNEVYVIHKPEVIIYDTSEVMNSFIESLKLDSTERTIPVYDISFIQEYLF